MRDYRDIRTKRGLVAASLKGLEMISTRVRVWIGILLSFCALTASAKADQVKTYRYSLSTFSGVNRYVSEVAPEAKGVTYRVESDSRGRNIVVTKLRDGDEIEKTVYSFRGNDKVPTSYKWYLAGVLTNVAYLRRDNTNSIVRQDSYDASGALSNYIMRTITGTSIRERFYTSAGLLTNDITWQYNADGVLFDAKAIWPGNTSKYTMNRFDPATGQLTEQKNFENDIPKEHALYIRDANGTVLEVDGYTSTGDLFVVEAYSNDNPIRIAFAGSPQKIIQLTYDSRQILIESEILIDGRLACRLTYQRALDNSIVKTQAWGPDGKLWAEFANVEVNEVSRDGTGDGRIKGTVYKVGNWW
jgi:hypothetical protein